MQISRSLGRWFRSRSTTEHVLLQNLIVWTIGAGLVIYVSRGFTFHQLAATLKRCDLTLFVAANVGSVLLRWLLDTFLFATLFSFFHRRTTYREVLPASTALYFLQAVNVLVADGAMVIFLHRRKGVEWLTAGWTMAFQGFVDAILMSSLTIVLALLVPWSPIRIALPYASAALAFFVCVAFWWMHGTATTRLGRWLKGRHGLRAFRMARLHHYIVLAFIRFMMYVPNAFAFYIYLLAFRLHVPVAAVLALSPALMFAQSAPVSPSGLGPLQAVMVDGLARFAPRDALLMASLGVSIVQLLCRIPMGVGSAGTFARLVLSTERSQEGSTRSPADAGEPRS